MTTTTSTYTSPLLSTFPANPLTTTFTAAASSCTGLYSSNGVFVVDADTDACLPSGFSPSSTDYFSPGIACPAGYVTACHDNAGVASVTTVTCCPYRGDVTLGCVTPSTLSDVWETLFCTWIAPEEATTVRLTLSADGTTSTAAVSVSSPGGLNALGVRMVYQSSDLSITSASNTGAATTTASTSASTSTSSTGSGSSGGGGGLSTGATVGIAVALSVAGIAAVTGAFLLMRKRRRPRAPYDAVVGEGSPDPKHHGGTPSPAGGYYGPPKDAHEVSGVGSAGVTNRQHELSELGAGSPPAELPGNDAWR